MPELKISSMLREDISEVAKIDNAVFSCSFKEADFYNYFENPLWHFEVAKIDEKAVGYISYMIICDEAEIVNICVLPEHRGLGIGKALLNEMIEKCKAQNAVLVHLEVRKSNSVAIKLYERFGFVSVGVSKNHYKEPVEDAIRMTKSF